MPIGKAKALIIAIFTIISASANADQLTLYAVNSPKPINWSTPRSLLLSTVKNFIKIGQSRRVRHEIGHAFVGFQCEGSSEVISGMTGGSNGSSFKDLVMKKRGMSIVLEDAPGEFEDHKTAMSDILDLSKANRVNALRINISNEKCLKLKSWHQKYSSLPYHVYGGLDKRPLKGEGSGCSAYIMSYLEVADIDYDYFNGEFLSAIYIPKRLLGGQLGENKKVGVFSVLRDRTPLSVPSPDSLKVEYYDPSNMYYWIQKKWLEYERDKRVQGLEKYNVQTSLFNKMKVIELTPAQ